MPDQYSAALPINGPDGRLGWPSSGHTVNSYDGVNHDHTVSFVAQDSNDKSWPRGSGNPISSSNNPWSHLYGIARKQINTDPEKSFAEEIRDLPDAYDGTTSELMGKILISQMTTTRSFWVNEICPIQYTNQITTSYKTWEFKDEFLSQVPEQGVPHLIRNTMASRSASVTRKGIGMYNEHMFLSTPMGEKGFWFQMEQINNATMDTAAHEVATKLYGGDEASAYRPAKQAGMTFQQFEDTLTHNINMFGAFQKYDDGFQLVVGKARDTMRSRIQKEGNLLIVPAGAEQYTWEGQLIDKGLLMRSGVRSDMRWWQTINGMVVRESRKFAGYAEDGADPAYNRRLTGGFTTITMNLAKHADIEKWSWRKYGAREIWSEYHDAFKVIGPDLDTYNKTGFAPGISNTSPDYQISGLNRYDNKTDFPFYGSSDSRAVTLDPKGSMRRMEKDWGPDTRAVKPIHPGNNNNKNRRRGGRKYDSDSDSDDEEQEDMSAFDELLKHNPQQKYAPWARQWFADMGWKSHGHAYEKQGLLDLLAHCITGNLNDENYKDLLYNHLFPGRQAPSMEPPPPPVNRNNQKGSNQVDILSFVPENPHTRIIELPNTSIFMALGNLKTYYTNTTLFKSDISKVLMNLENDYTQSVAENRAESLQAALSKIIFNSVDQASLIQGIANALNTDDMKDTQESAQTFIALLTFQLLKFDLYSRYYNNQAPILQSNQPWNTKYMLSINANAEVTNGPHSATSIRIPVDTCATLTSNGAVVFFTISDQEYTEYMNTKDGPNKTGAINYALSLGNPTLSTCVYASIWYYLFSKGNKFSDLKNVTTWAELAGISQKISKDILTGHRAVLFAQSLSFAFIKDTFLILSDFCSNPTLFDGPINDDEKEKPKIRARTAFWDAFIAYRNSPSITTLPSQIASVGNKPTLEEKDQQKVVSVVTAIGKQYKDAAVKLTRGSFTANYTTQVLGAYVSSASSDPATINFWKSCGVDQANILSVLTVILKSFEDVNLDKSERDWQQVMLRFIERLHLHSTSGIEINPRSTADQQLLNLIQDANKSKSIAPSRVIAALKAYEDEMNKKREAAREVFQAAAELQLQETFDARIANGAVESSDPLSSVTVVNGSLKRLPHSLLKQAIVENTPFTSYKFFKFVIEHDLPPCFGILSFRPNQEWEMGSLCLTMGGGEIGRHLVMMPDLQFQNDSMRKVMIGNFTVYMGTMITDPKGIVIVPDVYCRGYHGGWGVTEWDASNPTHRELQSRDPRAFDMYHCIIPAIYNAPKWMHLNGRMPHEIKETIVGAPEFSYPTAPYYVDYVWLNWWRSDETNLITNAFADQQNTLCFQDMQIEVDPKNPSKMFITNNKGPWDMTLYEGSARARAGGCRKLKEFNYENHRSLVTSAH